jgi:hypothetical protein
MVNNANGGKITATHIFPPGGLGQDRAVGRKVELLAPSTPRSLMATPRASRLPVRLKVGAAAGRHALDTAASVSGWNLGQGAKDLVALVLLHGRHDAAAVMAHVDCPVGAHRAAGVWQ